MSKEDLENQKPQHLQRESTQLVYCKQVSQYDAQYLQDRDSLQNNVIE